MSDFKMDTSDQDDHLDFNRVKYDLIPDVSLAIEKNQKKTNFQKTTYQIDPSSNAICTLNTGSNYIDGRASYLAFEIKSSDGFLGSSAKTAFAHQIFKSILITDRAGNEIERIDDLGRLATLRLKMRYTKSKLDTEAGILGTTSALTSFVRFLVPLRDLCGLFDFDQLLPPALMSGLRIELEFYPLQIALYKSGGAVSDGEVSNMHLLLETCTLTDSVVRALNERSAQNGLNIMINTFYKSSLTFTGADVCIENPKAVSRACGGYLTQRVPDTNDANEGKRDSHKSNAFSWTSYQWRAGNLYFPQQKYSTSTGELSKEAYYDAVKTTNKAMSTNDSVAVAYSDFKAGDASTHVAVDLERSSALDLSGIPLNNSRKLEFSGTTTDSGTAQTYRLWLKYVKVLRVFMDNTEIEE